MKAQFKNPLNSFAPVFLVLMANFVFGFGCNTSKPTPDPLAGWRGALLSYEYDKFDKAITVDYQDYIQKLPSNERNHVGPIQFFEDGTGQHAVKIEIALNGTDWAHVLIYDKDNKRIKVIKYAIGRYAS
jgi:hypothetical protein